MKINKVNELIGESDKSFEHAAEQVLRRAQSTLTGVIGLEVLSKRALVEDGRLTSYEVRVRLLFELAPETLWHV